MKRFKLPFSKNAATARIEAEKEKGSLPSAKDVTSRILPEKPELLSVAVTLKPARNLLEILSSRKVPDAALVIALTFLSGLTLAPYLGGRSLWILGGTPVTIPTLTEFMLWALIVGTPFMWMILLARIYGATVKSNVISLSIASASTFLLVGINSYFPTLALTAVDSSYSEISEVSAWHLTASHKRASTSDSDDGFYTLFRTEPINLEIQKGCAARIEKIEVYSNGHGKLEKKTAGFDFQVFVATEELLKKTVTLKQPNDKQIFSNVMLFEGNRRVGDFILEARKEPVNAEVKGRAVLRLHESRLDADADGAISISMVFDFKNMTVQVSPEEYAKKKIESTDIVVRDKPARLQFQGWTLYGSSVLLALHDPIFRISGKKHCSILSYL